MKRFLILFVLCLFYNQMFAQKFEKNFSLSPLVTFGNNSAVNPRVPSTSHISFGVSGVIQGNYNITDRFSLGTEFDYTYVNFKLLSDYKGDGIPESTIYYESKITQHSINIPVFIRLTTEGDWFYNIGLGVSYLFHSKTSSSLVGIEWMGDKKTNSDIKVYDDNIDNKLSPLIFLGLGKKFNLGKFKFYSEIRYNLITQNYNFKHIGTNDNYVDYNFKPQYVGMKIGMYF